MSLGTPYVNVTLTLLLPVFVNNTAQGLQQLQGYVPLGAQQIQGIIQAILDSGGQTFRLSTRFALDPEGICLSMLLLFMSCQGAVHINHQLCWYNQAQHAGAALQRAWCR